MSSLQSKFLARMFRRIDGVVWDLTSNKLGLQTENGILTLSVTRGERDTNSLAPAEDVYAISANPFNSFGFALPAFAQNTPISDIEVGDLIVGDTKALGWVVGKTERSLRLLDHNGMTKNYTPVKVQVLNQDGAMVVKSLTGLFGEQGAQGFGGSLLPFLMMGNGLGDLEDLFPILLMTQQFQGNSNPGGLTQLIPMMLMMKKSGNGGMIDKMLPMMMVGAFGGGGLFGGNGGGAGGMNPMMMLAMLGDEGGSGLGGLFGGSGVPAQLIGQKAPPLQPSSQAPQLYRTR